MLTNAANDRKTLCPLCYKSETLKDQDLVCGQCVLGWIELVRNSVIKNEEITRELRQEIDYIFDACDGRPKNQLPSSGVLDQPSPSPLPSPWDDTNDARHNFYLEQRKAHHITSSAAVKQLSLQLRRLEILNKKIKLQVIERSRRALEDRMISLQSRIDLSREKVQEREELVERKKHELVNEYEKELARIRLDGSRITGYDTLQVNRQAKLLRFARYKVIREIIFENYNSIGPDMVETDVKHEHGDEHQHDIEFDQQQQHQHEIEKEIEHRNLFLFYGQPIIHIPALLSNNNKLDTINNFVENLIRIQMTFKDLLFHMEPEVLPYIGYLKSLLPDEKFYNSVQKKLDAICKDVNSIDVLDKAPQEDAADVEFFPPEEPSVSFDKVIIQNNTIKIPVSSRTANLNRRASIRESDQESKEGEASTTQDVISIPSPKDNHLANALEGKKIVFVPHKILTRPFTRLKSKEYLKFVLVMVKILINFNIILEELDIRMPTEKSKVPKSMIDTLNDLRTKPKIGKQTQEEFSFDIEQILLRLANLDNHFKSQKSDFGHSHRGFQKNSANTSFVDLSLILTTTSESSLSASLVNVQSSMISRQNRPTNARRFYDVLIPGRRAQKNKNELADQKFSVNDLNVYGLISETQSSDTSSVSIHIKADNKKPNTGDRAKKEKYNVKPIMEVVHSLIAGGNFGALSTDPATQNIQKVTISMMEQSKAQLDDWDVISQMY